MQLCNCSFQFDIDLFFICIYFFEFLVFFLFLREMTAQRVVHAQGRIADAPLHGLFFLYCHNQIYFLVSITQFLLIDTTTGCVLLDLTFKLCWIIRQLLQLGPTFVDGFLIFIHSFRYRSQSSKKIIFAVRNHNLFSLKEKVLMKKYIRMTSWVPHSKELGDKTTNILSFITPF